jgi:hypothetical protein
MTSPQSPANRIAQIETRELNESTAAIMVAVNMDDRTTADSFVKEVLQAILNQRMISRPDTSLLCITLIGSVTTREFATFWRKHIAAQPAMAGFLKLMQAADVIHGTRDGKVLDQVSLLDPTGRAPSPRDGGPSSGTPKGDGWLARLKSGFKGGRA